MSRTLAAYSADPIQGAALTLQRLYPRLAPGSHVTSDALYALRDLAADCGMADPWAANDADLLSVYRVALRDPEAAKRTAQKIAQRLNPQPAPYYAPSNGPDVAQAIENALAPLQTAIQRMDDDLRADMGTLAREAAEAAVKALSPTNLVVTVNAAPPVALGLSHRLTGQVIDYLAAGEHVYLYGPAGSGKTTLGRMVAKALGLQFYMAAKVADEFMLLGFRDATGAIVRTPFRDAFEYGGLFLFDELDRSGASAVTAINSATANGYCAFPDGIVYAHKDFKVIAAGNTTMRGADPLYNAGEQQDASVLDRFSFIEFPYDDALEDALATNPDWLGYVRAVRATVAKQGLNIVVSPRATYSGQRLLERGHSWETVAASTIFKGLDPAYVETIQSATRHAWKG